MAPKEDIEELLSALMKTEELYGILGVFGLLLLIIVGASTLIYHKSYLIKWAQSSFEQSLANYKSDLLKDVGIKILEENSKLQTEIVKLTSKVNILGEQETNWLNEKRQSFIELYKSQVDLNNTIANQSIFDRNKDISFKWEDKEDEMKISNHNYSRALAAFQLYCEDKNLLDQIKLLVTKTVELKSVKSKQLLELQHLRLKNEIQIKTVSDQVLNKQVHNDRLVELRNKLHQEEIECLEKKEHIFLELLVENYKLQDEVCYMIQEVIKSTFKN